VKRKTKIALIGFGKMGQKINRLCGESDDFEVVSRSYEEGNRSLDLSGIKGADVAIDFTNADVVLGNIKEVAKLGKNMVVGTTGWEQDREKAKKIIKRYKTGLVYAPNFSIGVNIFLKVVADSAKLFSKYPDYDVYETEVHHKDKKDSPSGTALKVADAVMQNFPRKTSIQTEALDRKIKPNELHISSVRGGTNSGFHQVVFDSPADAVTLSHQAHNRSGFARGALLGAKLIKNKKGFYLFEELLKL
jgi:4-hydroxy-tetrahydrodipicolinate reductase